ncbi:MAG: hypothetical protein OXF88_22225 [Rhodobacteraceae bacterium]|nr:hypothetical protein [Paracoccaceae bacterium]
MPLSKGQVRALEQHRYWVVAFEGLSNHYSSSRFVRKPTRELSGRSELLFHRRSRYLQQGCHGSNLFFGNASF